LTGFDSKQIISRDIFNRAARSDFNTRLPTFRQKHLDDLTRTLAAEKLSEFFFVKFDAVPFDEFDKVLRRVTANADLQKSADCLETKFSAFRFAVGEIAASSAGN
jgi:hypothetical protein